MVKKKSFLAILMLSSSIVVILGSWYGFQKASISPQALEPIRIGLADQVGSGLVMVALEKGFFKEEGLAVEVKPYPSGKRALEEGLFESKADIISAVETAIVFPTFERSDYKVIATICEANNVNRIIANKKSGISTPDDLRGKRVATQPKSSTHFFLSLFLLKQGMESSDTNLMFLKSEILPKALWEGTVDAVSTREPFFSQAKKMLGKDAVVFSTPELYTQLEILVAGDTFLQQHPKRVEKFLKGVLRAEAYMKEYPDESLKLIANYLNTPYNTLRLIVSRDRYEVGLGQSLVESLDDQGRWAISDRLVQADEIPDFTTVIDGRWLEKLKPQSVTIIH